MRKTDKCVSAVLAVFFMISAASFVTSLCADGGGGQGSQEYDDDLTVGAGIVKVTDIADLPTTAIVGVPLTLTGTITPSNVAVQSITWNITNAGSTGAYLSGNILTASATGTVDVTAKVNYSPFVMVSAGSDHTVAINADGTLWAWGSNEYGQLGLGDYSNRDVPTQVGTDTNWAMVSAGDEYTLAIRTNGTLWAWGSNSAGKLGIGTSQNVPTRVGTDANWASVSAGWDHTAAIKTNGELWAWGGNSYGQLGVGDNTYRSAPSRVGADNNWASVSAGGEYTLAIRTNGTLWTWGKNDYRQLGDGTNANKNTPTPIGSNINWASVSAGEFYTVAIKTNGELWAWGMNNNGELGIGDNSNRNVPARAGTDADWAMTSSGKEHTVAVKTNGELWVWGSNTYGERGVGTNVDKYDPTNIAGFLTKDFSITVSTLRISTTSLPNGAVGTFYNQQLTSNSNVSPTWTITSGSLPAGLSISSNGVISGMPTSAGTFNFTVRAATGNSNFNQPLTLTVAHAPAATDGSIDPITIVLAAVAAAGVAAVVSIVMRPKR